MASATVRTETQVVERTEDVPVGYTLELSTQEASDLRAFLRNNHPAFGGWRLELPGVYAVADALMDVGA